tara:strand:+ start:14941 stop:15099 length:159 start_codon:yes stop_codon:yes gene_type:complete
MIMPIKTVDEEIAESFARLRKRAEKLYASPEWKKVQEDQIKLIKAIKQNKTE